ncbi:MAG TPA: N-acetylmuramoyl-L-alanine amidase [Rhizomicrobium sp.]|nr:N-acetylmuramoyl-L-alanine amidase [Rhizomicrobium sp.]
MLWKGGAWGVALVLAAAAAGAEPLPNPGHIPDSLIATPAPEKAPVSVPVVLGARVGEQTDRTRFVIELSDPINLRVFTLSNPDRVVVDMPEVLWRLQGADRPSGTGAVKAYRYGLFRPGDSRFVIDLNKPVAPAEPMILPPEKGFGYRVVLDLFPTSEARFAAASGWPADLRVKEAQAEHDRTAAISPPASPQSPTAEPQPPKARVVVIDAGHGGIDSGTIGVDGLLEKNLVLDEAQRLKKILQKRGYVVHLTRDTDIYIPLRERVNIARGYQADLFISLHADSNPDPLVSGASVYTLSESGSDKEAAALARKENQSDVIAGVDLSGENSPVASILIDLAQRDTMNRSSRFAETVVSQLPQATDVLPREPHRAAAFVVLKAPDVPAVLIELGYLSNAHDCAQMGTAEWRDATAQAIAGAVDRNFGQGSQPVPVASQTAE